MMKGFVHAFLMHLGYRVYVVGETPTLHSGQEGDVPNRTDLALVHTIGIVRAAETSKNGGSIVIWFYDKVPLQQIGCIGDYTVSNTAQQQKQVRDEDVSNQYAG